MIYTYPDKTQRPTNNSSQHIQGLLLLQRHHQQQYTKITNNKRYVLPSTDPIHPGENRMDKGDLSIGGLAIQQDSIQHKNRPPKSHPLQVHPQTTDHHGAHA